MARRLSLLFLLLGGLALQSGVATAAENRVVEVVDVAGPVDGNGVRFIEDSIRRAATSGNVELVVLQIDSPGVLASYAQVEELARLVSDPPLPLVAWIGPAPGEAFGGILQVAAGAPLTAAAPGAKVGWWMPVVAGRGTPARPADPALTAAEPPDTLLEAPAPVTRPISGVIDMVSPDTASIRQLLQALDGQTIRFGAHTATLSTVRPYTAPDGSQGVAVLPTIIREPGVWARFLGLATRPDPAFFFLVAGLTVAVFEFYAVGPGVAAAVAGLSLLLASYGLAVLPVRWWALGLVVLAVLALSSSYQRGGVPALTGLGLAGLLAAGLVFTGGGPQIASSLPGVLLTVAAAGFFFLLAMPVVARARFSTQTIGRSHLIGRRGMAVTTFRPDGEVEVDGARWRATAHREAAIAVGDEVRVAGVDGWYLEVEHPEA